MFLVDECLFARSNYVTNFRKLVDVHTRGTKYYIYKIYNKIYNGDFVTPLLVKYRLADGF